MINKSINLVQNKVNQNDMTEQELLMAPDHFFDEISVSRVFETSEDKDLFMKVCQKLTQGGKLSILGIDGVSLCRKVGAGEIKLSDLNELFLANKRLNSLIDFKKYFMENNWKIKFAGMKPSSRYFIEAIRP